MLREYNKIIYENEPIQQQNNQPLNIYDRNDKINEITDDMKNNCLISNDLQPMEYEEKEEEEIVYKPGERLKNEILEKIKKEKKLRRGNRLTKLLEKRIDKKKILI